MKKTFILALPDGPVKNEEIRDMIARIIREEHIDESCLDESVTGTWIEYG